MKYDLVTVKHAVQHNADLADAPEPIAKIDSPVISDLSAIKQAIQRNASRGRPPASIIKPAAKLAAQVQKSREPAVQHPPAGFLEPTIKQDIQKKTKTAVPDYEVLANAAVNKAKDTSVGQDVEETDIAEMLRSAVDQISAIASDIKNNSHRR